MKKLIALLLTISMLFSVTIATAGCGKGGQLGDGDDVIIRFHLDNLGYGTQWLAESCERFMEQQKEVEYPGGKKGVYCHIIRGNTPTANNLGGSTSHVVFDGGYGDTLAETGNVMNIDDIVKMEIPGEGKTIEEKMYPETRGNYRAGDTYNQDGTLIPGDYYTVPTHEIYAGLSYDKKVFDRYGFYFARRLDGDEVTSGNPNFDAYDYEDYFGIEKKPSKLIGGMYYFLSPKPALEDYTSETEYLADVKGWEEGKSCGPNGIYGDYDDGLPSSLYELFALWEYMKGTVSPLLVSGFQQSLANTFLDAMPMALMGYDKARGQFDLTGEVDAIVNFAYGGLSDNDYSTTNNVGNKNGLSYVEAPVIQKVEVTEESGYYTTWAVERYLTMAMMEVLVHEGFLDAASYPNKEETLNHLFSQKKFINSGHKVSGGGSGVGPEVAMLAEYSYWWNESSIRGNLTSFNKLNPTVEDREIRWMPLPVNIKTSVTGEDETVSFKFTKEGGPSFTRTGTEYTESKKGEKNLLVQASNNTLILNKKAIEKDSAVKQAVTDWMLFFHSDKELSAVTASQGFRKGLQYEMQNEDISNWATFYQDLYTLSENSDIIRLGADNETFAENATTIFSRGEGNKAWKCSHTDYFGCWRNTSFGQKGRNSCTCFISTMITKKEWEGYYRDGTHAADVVELYYPSEDPENKTPIAFVNGDGGQPW